MHPSLLSLLVLLVVASCTAGPAGAPPTDSPVPAPPTPTAPSESASEEPLDMPLRLPSDPVPTLSTIRSGDGAIGTITFRSDAGISISDQAPLRLRVGEQLFETPLHGGPARFTENDSVMVDQASYLLSREAFFTLVATPAAEVGIEVHDGTDYTAYPYVSGDLIE